MQVAAVVRQESGGDAGKGRGQYRYLVWWWIKAGRWVTVEEVMVIMAVGGFGCGGYSGGGTSGVGCDVGGDDGCIYLRVSNN